MATNPPLENNLTQQYYVGFTLHALIDIVNFKNDLKNDKFIT